MKKAGGIMPLAITALIFALIIPSLPVASSNVISSANSNSSYITENAKQGQITLFHQKYDNGKVPSNIFCANPLVSSKLFANPTFDGSRSALNFTTEENQSESLYIAGLVPMGKSTYTLRIGMKSNDPGSLAVIDIGNTEIHYSVNSTNYQRLAVLYHDSTGKLVSTGVLFRPTQNNVIEFTVATDMIARRVSVLCNSESIGSLPLFSEELKTLPYSFPTNPYVTITNHASKPSSYVSTYVYEITQRSDRNLVTPVGRNDIIPFGLDGPHSKSTIQDGTAYLDSAGDKGTIWIDAFAQWSYEPTEKAFVNYLVHNRSWEVGIHFSHRLTDLTLDQATALMRSEYDNISSAIGVAPKSYCALSGADNVTHAVWAYKNLGLLCRDLMAFSVPNVGNLDEDTWGWWSGASEAGMVLGTFTHRMDEDPAIRWSISPHNFDSWVDNYANNNMKIVPFAEWYGANANSFQATFSDIVATPGLIRFTAHTNGDDALANVNASGNTYQQIIDIKTGAKVNYSVNDDGSIAFMVSDGHTYVLGADSNPVFITYPRTSLRLSDRFEYTPECLGDAVIALEAKPAWLDWNESTHTLTSNSLVAGSFPVSLRAAQDGNISYQNFTINVNATPEKENNLPTILQKGNNLPLYVAIAAIAAGMGLLATVKIMRRRKSS